MQDVIGVLLKKLYNKIPPELLDLAFEPKKEFRTLDALVKEKVIVDTVLVDCNLYAGKLKKITLEEEWLIDIDSSRHYNALSGTYAIYKIPLDLRENRDIGHVIDLAFPSQWIAAATHPFQTQQGRSVSNGMSELLSSYTHTPAHNTPTPILRDNNIIELSPPTGMLHVDYLLTVMLKYDDNFSNISSNMVNPLFACVHYAAQLYIYNKLRIQLNQGFLTGGQQLDAIKQIVDGYSDAEERYEEALLDWKGSSFFDSDTLLSILGTCI